MQYDRSEARGSGFSIPTMCLSMLATLAAPGKVAAQEGARSERGGDTPAIATKTEPKYPVPDASWRIGVAQKEHQRLPLEGLQLPAVSLETTANTGDLRGPTEKQNGLLTFAMTIIGVSTSAMSLGWYYLQVRARTTAASLPTAMLFAANDIVLLGAALVTAKQGIGTQLVYGIFVLGNVAVANTLWRREGLEGASENPRRPLFDRFTTTDKACIVACGLGMLSLVASKIPFLTRGLDAEQIVLCSAGIATAVNIVACVPLYVNALAAPKPDEKLDVTRGRLRAISLTVTPLALGTVGLLSSLFTIDAYSLSTLMSPLGLALNNTCLTVAFGVWAWRRSAKPASA